ncbi:MAG: hypothetical protein II085_00090, partial [Alphaproteobacteria bacterium]|nr:hypothetical protein [Alphaproteobacteria bacterium]
MNADFEGNAATAGTNAFGGALYNSGTIGVPQPAGEANYIKLVITDDSGNVTNTLYLSYLGDEPFADAPMSLDEVTSGEYNFTQNEANSIQMTESEFIEEFLISSRPQEGQTELETALNDAAKEGFTQVNPEDYNAPEPTQGYIMGNFIGNHVEGDHADGGAIYNIGTITEIIGDFISNYGHSTGTGFPHTISSIAGGQSSGSEAKNNDAKCGGAIYNAGIDATIGNITGNFTDNRYLADHVQAFGGGIFNISGATIGNIDGDFTENYTIGQNNIAAGGAIYNAGYAYDNGTTGQEGGRKNADSDVKYGASTIGDLTGDFKGNYAKGTAAMGGAIYNAGGGIISLDGLSSGNNAEKDGSADNQVTLLPEIGNITGNFTGNYAESLGLPENTGNNDPDNDDDDDNDTITLAPVAMGGAIYNENAKIGDIKGDFKENYAVSSESDAMGGAIANVFNGKLNSIEPEPGNGGEKDKDLKPLFGDETINSNIIFGKIGTIEGSFEDNHANAGKVGVALGGAIANNSYIEKIQNSQFKNNYVLAANGEAYGGAIANKANIGLDMPLNQARFEVIYIMDDNENTIATLYKASSYDSETGKYVSLSEDDITSGQYNFPDDVLFSAITLENFTNSVLNNETNDDDNPQFAVVTPPGTDLSKNAAKGGDEKATRDNQSQEKQTGGELSPDKETDNGTATKPTQEERLAAAIEAAAERGVYYSTVNPADYSAELVTTGADSIINSSFTNNYVKATGGNGYGGAIYTTKDLMLTSKDEYEFLFDGNYVEDKNGTRPEAVYVDAGASAKFVEGAEVIDAKIYMTGEGGIGWYSSEDAYIDHIESASEEPPTLTVNAINNGRFTINDQIVGSKEASDAQGTITYSENPYIYKYRELGHGVYDEQLDQKVWAFVTAIQDNETGEWYETQFQEWSVVTGT